MNALDAVVVLAAIAAAIGGWRFGFVARVLAWAGVALGLMIGIHFVPGVVTAFGGTASDDRVTVALLFLVLVATLGQGIGLAVGALVHRIHPEVRGLPVWDRAAGAAVGLVGVLTLLWMVIPSLATAEGWPARAARGSAIVNWINSYAPTQPSRFAAWGREISEAPYPSALGPLDDPPDPGKPPTQTLPPAIDATVRASVVLVRGNACTDLQEGSGWVASPGLVVTNAHVVAGESDTEVQDANHVWHAATVVAFDPRRDIAILQVPSMTDVPPLPQARGTRGETTAVYGHPGGQTDVTVAPARIGGEISASGTDIYRNPNKTPRHVYVLAARLRPGDSGAPVVSLKGDVVGVAFAIDPAHLSTAYAVTDVEVDPVLHEAHGTPVKTGPCLVGG
jgi:S1-C subfamily serine protease